MPINIIRDNLAAMFAHLKPGIFSRTPLEHHWDAVVDIAVDESSESTRPGARFGLTSSNAPPE